MNVRSVVNLNAFFPPFICVKMILEHRFWGMKQVRVGLRTGLVVGLLSSQADAAVLWMEQAQRLQEVSATLLDSAPVASPLPSGLNLGMRADVSFLPTPNPRVGSKLESLPSSPVQALPTIFASAALPLGSIESLSAEVWAGVLPKGVEKLMGIQASLFQYQWGARSEISSARLGAARFVLGAGLAQTKSFIEGKISSANGGDTFTASTQLLFANLGVQHVRSGFWGGVTLGSKKTRSRLAIEEDNTDLEVSDTLANAKQPRWTQVSLGLNLTRSIGVTVSELMVPDRVDLPRISVSWTAVSPSGAPRE